MTDPTESTEKERALMQNDLAARVSDASALITLLPGVRWDYLHASSRASAHWQQRTDLLQLCGPAHLDLSPYHRLFVATIAAHDSCHTAAERIRERYRETWDAALAALPPIAALERLLGETERTWHEPTKQAWPPTAYELAVKLGTQPTPSDL